MFPFISVASGSGLLVAPGHFPSNSSTFFLKTGEVLISPGKKSPDSWPAWKQPEKKPSQNWKKENEKLASEEMDRFPKRTSSSFDRNALKILNELNTLH